MTAKLGRFVSREPSDTAEQRIEVFSVDILHRQELETVGLAHKAHDFARNLSYGQQKLVEFEFGGAHGVGQLRLDPVGRPRERGRPDVTARTEGVTSFFWTLEEFCRGELASFKVPQKIVVRDSLPRTATGKTIRDAATLLGNLAFLMQMHVPVCSMRLMMTRPCAPRANRPSPRSKAATRAGTARVAAPTWPAWR